MRKLTQLSCALIKCSCVSPVFHLCFTCVSPVSHLCLTCVSPVSHLCFICVSPVSCLCFTCVSPVFHLCLTCVSPVFHLCLTCVSPVSHLFHLCRNAGKWQGQWMQKYKKYYPTMYKYVFYTHVNVHKRLFNLPPQFSRLGIRGPASHYLSVLWCICVLCGELGWFLVSFFSFV